MRKILIFFTTLTLSVTLVSAQIRQCLEHVEEAVAVARESCDSLGRNQICYAHPLLEAEGTSDFVLEELGDIDDLEEMHNLNLGSYKVDTNEWGIALLAIQANISNTLPGQNVTMIAFGNTQIANEVGESVEVILSANQGANVRTYPSADNSIIIGSLAMGDNVVATGQYRNGDGERWLRVQFDSSTTGTGWVADWLLDGDNSDMLEVVSADSINLNPMQVFALTTTIGAPSCEEAYLDGLLIQTPSGAGRISLNINGIEFSIGSTLFLTIVQDDVNQYILAATLEGQAIVTVNNVTQSIGAGQATLIPIEDTRPVGSALAPRSTRDVFASVGVPLSEVFFDILLGLMPASELDISFEGQVFFNAEGEEIDIPAGVIIFREGIWNVQEIRSDGYVSDPDPRNITAVIPGMSFLYPNGWGGDIPVIVSMAALPDDPNTYYGVYNQGGFRPHIYAYTITFTSPTTFVGGYLDISEWEDNPWELVGTFSG